MRVRRDLELECSWPRQGCTEVNEAERYDVDKGRREVHLCEIRNAAVCAEQLVGKEECKGSFLMHYVCQECGCVHMSDMCWFYIENAKRRSTKKCSVLHCGYCGARFSSWDKGCFVVLSTGSGHEDNFVSISCAPTQGGLVNIVEA